MSIPSQQSLEDILSKHRSNNKENNESSVNSNDAVGKVIPLASRKDREDIGKPGRVLKMEAPQRVPAAVKKLAAPGRAPKVTVAETAESKSRKFGHVPDFKKHHAKMEQELAAAKRAKPGVVTKPFFENRPEAPKKRAGPPGTDNNASGDGAQNSTADTSASGAPAPDEVKFEVNFLAAASIFSNEGIHYTLDGGLTVDPKSRAALPDRKKRAQSAIPDKARLDAEAEREKRKSLAARKREDRSSMHPNMKKVKTKAAGSPKFKALNIRPSLAVPKPVPKKAPEEKTKYIDDPEPAKGHAFAKTPRFAKEEEKAKEAAAALEKIMRRQSTKPLGELEVNAPRTPAAVRRAGTDAITPRAARPGEAAKIGKVLTGLLTTATPGKEALVQMLGANKYSEAALHNSVSTTSDAGDVSVDNSLSTSQSSVKQQRKVVKFAMSPAERSLADSLGDLHVDGAAALAASMQFALAASEAHVALKLPTTTTSTTTTTTTTATADPSSSLSQSITGDSSTGTLPQRPDTWSPLTLADLAASMSRSSTGSLHSAGNARSLSPSNSFTGSISVARLEVPRAERVQSPVPAVPLAASLASAFSSRPKTEGTDGVVAPRPQPAAASAAAVNSKPGAFPLGRSVGAGPRADAVAAGLDSPLRQQLNAIVAQERELEEQLSRMRVAQAAPVAAAVVPIGVPASMEQKLVMAVVGKQMGAIQDIIDHRSGDLTVLETTYTESVADTSVAETSVADTTVCTVIGMDERSGARAGAWTGDDATTRAQIQALHELEEEEARLAREIELEEALALNSSQLSAKELVMSLVRDDVPAHNRSVSSVGSLGSVNGKTASPRARPNLLVDCPPASSPAKRIVSAILSDSIPHVVSVPMRSPSASPLAGEVTNFTESAQRRKGFVVSAAPHETDDLEVLEAASPRAPRPETPEEKMRFAANRNPTAELMNTWDEFPKHPQPGRVPSPLTQQCQSSAARMVVAVRHPVRPSTGYIVASPAMSTMSSRGSSTMATATMSPYSRRSLSSRAQSAAHHSQTAHLAQASPLHAQFRSPYAPLR